MRVHDGGGGGEVVGRRRPDRSRFLRAQRSRI